MRASQGEATGRAIKLAHFVNTPLYVVHVMSVDAMEEVAAARKAGHLASTTCYAVFYSSHVLRFSLLI
jgi:dihydroorotase-like cyclic amidohydrolase